MEWLKLGLQGVTVVFASGDWGVASRLGCLRHTNQTVFSPAWPATCPYVLAVGGTVLPKGSNVSQGGEVATTEFLSGGGFSNVHPRPGYQAQAVDAYFRDAPATVQDLPFYNVFTKDESIGANGGVYNRDGRGFPDVSALGQNIVTVTRGMQDLSSGTSASAPIWASLLNLVNEERIAAGKSTVGFVNPVLYQHPEIFNDVTVGNNAACWNPDPTADNTVSGFEASKGWDPVTGLGTPDFEKLLALFMSLD